MKKIDLHTHSFFSDGEDSPETLVRRFKTNGVSLGAITDHNYLSDEVVRLSRIHNKNFQLLQGVEVSCTDHISGESLHILGYSLEFNQKKINNALVTLIDGYNTRAQRIIKVFNKKYEGLQLDFDSLQEKYKEAYVSRNTLARELVAFFGQEKISFKEAAKEAFAPEDDLWMLEAEEVVDIIKNSNGVAVLAHPGRILEHSQDSENLFERLVSYGLRGMEVWYPKHDEKIRRRLSKMCERYDLAMTAGSDWHGEQYTAVKNTGHEIIEDVHYQRLIELLEQTKK